MGAQSDRAEDRAQGSVVLNDAARPSPRTRPAKRPATEGPAASTVPGLAARKAAARLLAAVVDAKSPLDGMTDAAHGHPQFMALDMRDRTLVRAILATTLRYRRTIEALIAARLKSHLPPNATTLAHILHVAAAQILFLDIPDSAAVDLAVTHAKSDPRAARFSGLVNGLLRSLSREKERDLSGALETVRDAPDWFIERLRGAFGFEQTDLILAAHRAEGATDFTVKTDPEHWAGVLGGVVLPTGTVRVERLAGAVCDLPGYGDGAWWVQDAAAALPARLFGSVEGLRIADLCAAPGGKTAQLAAAGAAVTAVDASRGRLTRLRENLARLKLDAQIIEADIETWTPERPFDAVLLDAPCSSTGTVRRHPDVPWTKTPDDIDRLAALQARLLARAVDFVRPGGLLVFSNCSLDPAEGEAVVDALLAHDDRVAVDPVTQDDLPGCGAWLTAEGYLRTTPAGLPMATPALSGLDGFFAARLRRR